MPHSVLIIGCGAIAGGYDAGRAPNDWPLSHAGAIARDDRFDLAACVEPDKVARKAFAQRWDVPVVADDPGGLGGKAGQYDVIVIASPTQFHAEHLNWARSMRPKAVFCEKPVAKDAALALALHEQFAAEGIPLIVNYTRRWQPALGALIDQIGNETWGQLISAVGTYGKGIIHNGSHLLDLLQMFVGPMTLHSVGPHRFDHWEEDPSVSALLTADDTGQPVHLVAGDSTAFTQFELVLTYKLGEIAIRDGGFRIETRRVEESDVFAGHRVLARASEQPGRYEEAMSLAYSDLASVIEHGHQPKHDRGNAALQLCEEIRKNALETRMKDPE